MGRFWPHVPHFKHPKYNIQSRGQGHRRTEIADDFVSPAAFTPRRGSPIEAVKIEAVKRVLLRGGDVSWGACELICRTSPSTQAPRIQHPVKKAGILFKRNESTFSRCPPCQ